MLEWVANFDILGDGMHSLDPSGGCDGRDLFRVAVDVSGQADDVLVNRNADMSCIEAQVEFQFIDDILPELRVMFLSMIGPAHE